MSRRRRQSLIAKFEVLEPRDCPAVVGISGPELIQEDGRPVTITARLSEPQSTPVDVRYFVYGSASLNADYRLSAARPSQVRYNLTRSGSLTFRPGQTEIPITVTPVNDKARESVESFTFHLISASGQTIGNQSATVAIQDNDNYVATLEASERAVAGERVTCTMRLSSPATKTETFYVTTENGSAVAGQDFYPAVNLPVRFRPGETFRQFSFATLPNTSEEYDESFAVRVRSKNADCPVAPLQLIRIAGKGPSPLPTLTVGDAALREGNIGTAYAAFTLTLSEASPSAVSVTYATVDGSASAQGKDYGTVSGTLIFRPGETSKTISVPVYGDTTAEPDETFSLLLSGAIGSSLARTSAVATIRNDDALPLPTLSVADAAVAEGNTGFSIVVFTVSLSFPSAVPVTVAFTTGDGTALSGDNDYSSRGLGLLSFPAGVTQQSFFVYVTGDSKQEPDEDFYVRLFSPTNATLSRPQAKGTIWNDDSPSSVGAWTIMVYMTGDNLNTFAHADINEMERALVNLPSSVKIVVSWDQPQDRTKDWAFSTANGDQSPWRSYGRSVLVPDLISSTFNLDLRREPIISSFDLFPEDRNTGDPATLVDFVQWGMTKAPAQRYALMMWGHGGGLVGSNWDVESLKVDGSGFDEMEISEMSQALSTAGMPRFDLVGYDNCLMGMLEVGYALSPALAPGGTFVASQELEDGTGHNYATAFNVLRNNPYSVTASALADGIVRDYLNQQRTPGNDTYSASNAAAFATLVDSIGTFTGLVLSSRNEPLRLAMANAIRSTTFYGADPIAGTVKTFGDLGRFMQNVSQSNGVSQELRDSAQTVLSRLQSTIFAKTADQRQSSGLSVYLRADGAYDSRYVQDAPSFVSATQWDQFVRWVNLGV